MSEQQRELEEIRQSLAKIDTHLREEMERRARLAKRASELRGSEPGQLPPLETMLETVLAKASGDLPVESLRVIFRELIGSCLTLELPAKIAVIGPEGSAASVAARQRFGAAASLTVHETAAGALADVQARRAEYAVLPLEAKTEGPIQSTIEALMTTDLRIASVECAPATLHVMNKSGLLADVNQVAGTVADQTRAERFLATLPEPSSLVDARSPLHACQLAQASAGTAALVTEEVGTAQGLRVARRNPQAEEIRYAVVGGRPSSRTGHDITALAFSVQDTPGALLGVLQQFSERGVNMLTLQSHPEAGDGWNYLFFVEVDGHASDRALVTAFDGVKKVSRFFKVLGSYPAE